MANLVIRNVDEATLARLKSRAANNKRSLQAELQVILERASMVDNVNARKLADKIRRKLSGRKHSDSAVLIREDRER
ncbi:MAG TPA: hypothetical protein VJ276_04045 [Thermoanaerobaculia bacterium]|nr:hypothetical protein [Thermoanaerobaculia bacterium]